MNDTTAEQKRVISDRHFLMLVYSKSSTKFDDVLMGSQLAVDSVSGESTCTAKENNSKGKTDPVVRNTTKTHLQRS